MRVKLKVKRGNLGAEEGHIDGEPMEDFRQRHEGSHERRGHSGKPRGGCRRPRSSCLIGKENHRRKKHGLQAEEQQTLLDCRIKEAIE